jgi:hypothetical protein
LLIAAAFAVGRGGATEPAPASVGAGADVPAAGNGVRPWLIGLGAFLASGGFVARPEKSWTGLIGGVFLLVAAWYVVRRMARSPWWNVRHRQALVSGTLLTCAWLGFFVTWLLWPEDRIAWFGNVLFVLVAIALVLVMARRTREAEKGENGRPAPREPFGEGQ